MACHDFQDKYSQQDIDVLKQMHTKQLLNERNRLYQVSEFCGDCRCSQDPECQICFANQQYNIEQVKAILATREHVLNKKESKELRKQHIKEGK